ncbi:transketolase C-terminal domain-containing protein [Acrocarpospora catenulata]|uniref:transketolase C-terminal domain-containing protein n=1 Tax=Acrocarpospora catenulata TaxID=2836182 RepID=UPI001BD92BAD|nr:transketolase C-terminal domain-containing protein [Acrocarpospora catenulata]
MRRTLSWVPRREFLRVLAEVPDPGDRARAFATMSRINTLHMISRAGSGHLGSSFSAADLVAWLLLAELREPFTAAGDVYFSSKGHDAPGLYASLIGLGLLGEDLLHRLRRLDGLPGHPDVNTPGMPFNTGSLGMGISKAKGLILADRLSGRRRRVYVLTGDGELQEGQNWEALAGAARQAMGELTVIVDHNKIQSDTWVRDVSDLGDLAAKFTAAGWAALRCDGHDVAAIAATLAERRTAFAGQPAVIVADTVKGGGCATFAATSMAPGEWRYRHHSGAPTPQDHDQAQGELLTTLAAVLEPYDLEPVALESATVDLPAKPGGPRLPEIYGRLLTERAANDERVVALDADLILDTGLIPFRDAHPGRFVECGIAEQDMVSMAGGLAAGGMVPFAHSFSCFLHARPNEQIYNNATEGRRVVYVGSLAGLLPAAPGHSHQAVRDVGALSGVPGLVILEPAHAAELAEAVDYCLTAPDSVYLRLASVPVPAEVAALPAAPLVTGRGQVVRPGDGSVVALGAGPVVLAHLLRAAERLAGEGVSVTVANLPWHNRLDSAWLAELVAEAGHLFVVEHQYARGGQADLIARTLLDLDPWARPTLRGLALTGIPRCGADDEVLTAHGLHADNLAAAIGAALPPRLETADGHRL